MLFSVGQLVLLKEYANFSTVYVGQISHVYDNRLIAIVVSETNPFLPRTVKIKNRVWETVIRDSDIQEGRILVKPFPILTNIMELL